jgi:hypothetical protein
MMPDDPRTVRRLGLRFERRLCTAIEQSNIHPHYALAIMATVLGELLHSMPDTDRSQCVEAICQILVTHSLHGFDAAAEQAANKLRPHLDA